MSVKNQYIEIDTDQCCGCGDCVEACPVGVLELSGDCVQIAEDVCIGCMSCSGVCPMNIISEA